MSTTCCSLFISKTARPSTSLFALQVLFVVALDDDKDIDGLPTLDAIADTISGPNAEKSFAS